LEFLRREGAVGDDRPSVAATPLPRGSPREWHRIFVVRFGKGGAAIATSHVGLALRDESGVLRFMPASAPRNFGKVVIDARLSASLVRDKSHAGILVARPLR